MRRKQWYIIAHCTSVFVCLFSFSYSASVKILVSLRVWLFNFFAVTDYKDKKNVFFDKTEMDFEKFKFPFRRNVVSAESKDLP